MFPEPHSEKQVEDCVGWALDAGRSVLEHTKDSPAAEMTREQAERLLAGVRCPVLVIHGDRDRITPLERGRRVAELTGGELVVLEGSGHGLDARDPVKVNVLMEEFAARVLGARPAAQRRWTRAPERAAARALRVLADRPRPRAARHRDRARAARARARARDRLARAASADGRARGGGRARAPRERRASPPSPGTSSAPRASTRSTSSRRSGRWTRSCSPTTWSSATSCASSPTTSGSATRRGTSTTSCTRTRRTSARRSCS